MIKTILAVLGILAIIVICFFVCCACMVSGMIENEREYKNDR